MNSTTNPANATEKLMNFRWNHLHCTHASPRLAHVLYFLVLDKKAAKLQLT